MKTLEKINALNALAECINPTIVYNEGWMIRLLVMQAIEEKTMIVDVDFGQIQCWTSEALISSPFSGAALKAMSLNETRTHVDVILGDIEVNYSENKGADVAPEAKIVGVIEAKMNSKISPATKNAKKYNQISRTVSCLAYNAPAGCRIFVWVVAPESTLEKYKVADQIEKGYIQGEINGRLDLTYNGNIVDITAFNANVERCEVRAVSIECWIEKIKDKDVKDGLTEFYFNCKKYNRLLPAATDCSAKN